MKVSIRENKTDHGLTVLRVFRPRERAFALPGTAYETKSGYWIVYVPAVPADVVENEADAAFALQEYYDKVGGAK